MKGDIVRDEDCIYEVIYDGAHRGRDEDLLVPVSFEEKIQWSTPVRRSGPTGRRDFQDVRERLIELLPQRATWSLLALRDALGLDYEDTHGLVKGLIKRGIVERVAYGVVQLARKRAA